MAAQGLLAVPRKKAPSTPFGRQLRSLREAKGLTLAELGELVGMKQQAVSRLETGPANPTWETVLKLAEALGVEPNDFKGDDADAVEDTPEPPPPPRSRPMGKFK